MKTKRQETALASVGNTIDEINASLSRELTQQSNMLEKFYGLHPEVPISDWLNWVLLAADSFIVRECRRRKSCHCGVSLV